MGSVVGHVTGHMIANANIIIFGTLVTCAPARRCPGTRTKAKRLYLLIAAILL